MNNKRMVKTAVWSILCSCLKQATIIIRPRVTFPLGKRCSDIPSFLHSFT